MHSQDTISKDARPTTIPTSPTLLPSLQPHLVPDLPPTLLYIPSCLPSTLQASLLTTITTYPTHKWTQLSHRRLLSLPSPLTGTARDTLLAHPPLPNFLTDPILALFTSLDIFSTSPHGAPNHVLVNEYLPGQGIMPHEDGPAYWPVTATISLGSHVVLDIYEKSQGDDEGGAEQVRKPKWRILQEPGSLLVTMGELYGETLHGIAEVEVDEQLGPEGIANWELVEDKEAYTDDVGRKRRGMRVSLTYRDVRKVAKLGGALKMFGKR